MFLGPFCAWGRVPTTTIPLVNLTVNVVGDKQLIEDPTINHSMSPSKKGSMTMQLRSCLDRHHLAKCWILMAMSLKAWHYYEKQKRGQQLFGRKPGKLQEEFSLWGVFRSAGKHHISLFSFSTEVLRENSLSKWQLWVLPPSYWEFSIFLFVFCKSFQLPWGGSVVKLLLLSNSCFHQ